MKTIPVKASRNYDVLIGSGLLDTVGSHVSQFKKVSRVCIVSDSNVWPLYGSKTVASLNKSGIPWIHFVFPAGEEQKNATTYVELLNFLAENQITRTDMIIALGGGVAGDLAGFAAATYLRGISFIQMPTTLLAAVDSSVGGKTGIDLPSGKNLAGAFCQPSLVICDVDCLDTLPGEIFRDGCAEVIKYGILYDPKLFACLSDSGLNFDRESVIARCVELKRDVVAEDEFDTGMRMKLNLGHTFGHGVEKLSNYQISHGRAVAIGMAMAARAANAMELCTPDVKDAILNILKIFGLPDSCSYPPETLADTMLSDKKRTGGSLNLILPESIGQCNICPIPITEAETFIKAGL